MKRSTLKLLASARPASAPPGGVVRLLCVTALAMLLACVVMPASAQGFDEGFLPTAQRGQTARVLDDGGILIAGEFPGPVFGAPDRLIRLRNDGQRDPAFQVQLIDGTVIDVLPLPDGKILIAGSFQQIGVTARRRIARLHADGRVDTGFDAGASADDLVAGLLLQPDGRIIVVGEFTTFAGQPRTRVARIHADGGFDPSFDPGAGADALVYTAALHRGGLLLGGTFERFDGQVRNGLVAVDFDGRIDPGFVHRIESASGVLDLLPLDDGSVLIGGVISTIDGRAVEGVARLRANGSLDPTFVAQLDEDVIAFSLALASDGRLLVGCGFSISDDTPRKHVVRLRENGARDTSFGRDGDVEGWVYDVRVQEDGKLLAVGEIDAVNGIATRGVARLHPDGAHDAGFDPGATSDGFLYAIAQAADGDLIVGGEFTSIGGSARANLARLQSSGAPESSFATAGGPNAPVLQVLEQADGRVLIGGFFSSYAGVARARLARITAFGSLDPGFVPTDVGYVVVTAMALQPDGKLLVAGRLPDDGVDFAPGRVFRYLADGTLDPAFNRIRSDSPVNALALQPDGSILLAGPFTAVNGIARRSVARARSNGALDFAFQVPGEGFDRGPVSMLLQPDGRILIGGEFTTIDGEPRAGIARLDSDGSVDASFDAGSGPGGFLFIGVSTMSLDTEGRITLGGYFDRFDGMPRNGLARLLPDGSLDSSFSPDPSPGAPMWASAALLQADGRYVAGVFNDPETEPESKLLRRFATPEPIQQSVSVDRDSVTWRRARGAPELALPPRLAFSVSGNPNTFVDLGTMPRVGDAWRLAGLDLPLQQTFYLRMVSESGNSASGGRGTLVTRQFVVPLDIFESGFESSP
jgi:uncharacterized delta-60 repeat protein